MEPSKYVKQLIQISVTRIGIFTGRRKNSWPTYNCGRKVRLEKTENQIQRAGVDLELTDCTFGAIKGFQ